MLLSGANRCGPVSTSGGKEMARGINKDDTLAVFDRGKKEGSESENRRRRGRKEVKEKERGREKRFKRDRG